MHVYTHTDANTDILWRHEQALTTTLINYAQMHISMLTDNKCIHVVAYIANLKVIGKSQGCKHRGDRSSSEIFVLGIGGDTYIH